MRMWWAALALLAASCGGPSASAPASGAPQVAPALASNAGAWTEFTPHPTVIDGRTVTPTCSHAPGADPAFRFWAKRGTANGLVVYFDGGGACWNDATCSAPTLLTTPDDAETYYKAELLPRDNPNHMQGIFDLSDQRNPVRDWSFVFVPYCTGDVHSGSHTASYTNPQTHEAFSIEHRGADNFRVIMEWIRANFSAPDQILVTGSSAGAYGAATHFAEVRGAFPNGHAAMLGDAGQGVTTDAFVAERNRNWNFQLPEAVFGANWQLTADTDVLRALAQHYPADRFAQYTTARDHVQIGFYGLMTQGDACREWTQQMTRDLIRRELSGNFRAYLASGETHTILRSPLFYTEQSGGMPFAQWLTAMLSSNGTGWDTRTCPECATPQRQCAH